MSSLPAQVGKIPKRGLLKETYYADIVIFDPKKISDKATYMNPHQYPVGIHYVIVNGCIVVEDGKHTGKLPGVVLRGPGYQLEK
jgi:N-acyl-D-amino-acid deacylase